MVEPYRSEMRTEAISLCDALSSRASVTRMCTTSRRMFWMLHSASDALREEEVREEDDKREGGRWRENGEIREGVEDMDRCIHYYYCTRLVHAYQPHNKHESSMYAHTLHAPQVYCGSLPHSPVLLWTAYL